MYTPDKWMLVKIKEYLKVFGVWSGGYLSGDSWKLNSGIVKVEEDDEYYHFYGNSGSVYKCNKRMYGSTAYGHSILHSISEKALNNDFSIEVIAEYDVASEIETFLKESS